MEQGFSDACVNLCLGQEPVARLAQTCRSAAIEMPRPTIRKWCEHGYTVAFQKTVKDLLHYFDQAEGEPIDETPGFVEEEEELKSIIEENQEEVVPDVSDSAAETETQETTEANAVVDEVPVPAASAEAVVSRTIPITLDDETIELAILEGQSPEDAVVVFCRANVADDVSGCIRQLLPTVLERLE